MNNVLYIKELFFYLVSDTHSLFILFSFINLLIYFLGTYSNKYNHPTVIREERVRIQIP